MSKVYFLHLAIRYRMIFDNKTPYFLRQREPYVRKTNPQKPFTVDKLIIYLVRTGYRYFRPLSLTWSIAFVYKKGDNVLCILIRKNGIDLRLYANYIEGVSIIEGRHIAMHGGELYRNHFYGSNTLITAKIANIASRFTRGDIPDTVKEKKGCSYRLKPNFAEIKSQSSDCFKDKYKKMIASKEARDISDYIRNDCGGYLGAGE